MSRRRESLLALLADGSLHSGAALAGRLGVSRAAVWKLVGELRGCGIDVTSVPRSGYRLPGPVELLDAGRIGRALESRGWQVGPRLEVLFEVDSTNTRLYEAPWPVPGQPRISFAELQQAGRGRRGRSWLAPFGSGLTFSVAWSFAETPGGLPALGLAVGAGVALALRTAGIRDVQVKWPNDLVWRGAKLGGLLLQLRTEAGGAASVVAGLGVNLALPAGTRATLAGAAAQPVADLQEAAAGRLPGRNELAALCAAAMLDTFDEFERDGYAAFAPRWAELDALRGARVSIAQADGSVEGVACGTDDDGALLVQVDGTLQRFHSGDVSVRTAPA